MSPAAELLTAQTWQIEEVTMIDNGISDVTYKRGAANNDDDFSLVRQTFKTDGTITYVDQYGFTGKNGKWKLLENDTKLRLGMGDFSVIVENVTVSENSFSYRTMNQEGYALFKFSPAD